MQNAGRKGDESASPTVVHPCPSCPHVVWEQAEQGSGDVLINLEPALRVGDQSEQSTCFGLQSWMAVSGEGSVLINNLPAHRKGDITSHCGGEGTLQTGSANVFVGTRTDR
jgi:uncharacterized Zn-binding protein involved in type VI secretion